MVARVIVEVFAVDPVRAMQLLTILNRCHRFPGFVYQQARFGPDQKSIEIAVRPRKGSAAICSGCHQPAPGYDHLPERRFEFIPFWGYLVFLLYCMRRVNCRNAASSSKKCRGAMASTLTKAYMLFWRAGRANSPGRKPPKSFALPGTRSSTRWSIWSPGGWSIASWGRFAPSAWTRSSTAKATNI